MPRAAINLVTEAIDLTGSIFRAVGGIMSMPTDMAKAVPKNIQKNEPAQVQQPSPVQVPQKELDAVKQ